jgi:aminopeptidase N
MPWAAPPSNAGNDEDRPAELTLGFAAGHYKWWQAELDWVIQNSTTSALSGGVEVHVVPGMVDLRAGIAREQDPVSSRMVPSAGAGFALCAHAPRLRVPRRPGRAPRCPAPACPDSALLTFPEDPRVAARRPDALFHPVYLGPRRGLDVNPYEPPPKERSEPWQGPIRPVRDRAFHTEHLALDLEVDVARGRLRGTATLTLVSLVPALAEVELDARELAIKGVKLRGRRLRSRHADGRLLVRLDRAYAAGEALTIAVTYAARPRTGFWFVRPDRAYPERLAQGWSQGQAEDSAFWFPVHDHPNDKFTTDIKVTADAALRTVANGRLVRRTRRGARTTWLWKLETPQPAYLVSLAVAPYVETRAKAAGVPLRFYAFAGQERAARRLYGRTGDMMKVFSRLFGPYPWREYSQVVVSEFTWGGMENTGATTLTEKALMDERAAVDISYEGLVAHELAHQWWGDLVTCRGWHHNWLNESWATFSENLYNEVAHGEDVAAWDRIQKTSQYLAQDLGQYRRPIVTDRYGIPMDLFDRHAYEKGSLVLTMLRDELGDEAFFRGAQLHLGRHAHGFADTHEFRRALEDASGRDLVWFFEQWVYQAGYPEIEARWRSGASGEVELVLTQAQDTSATGPRRHRSSGCGSRSRSSAQAARAARRSR